MSIGIFNSEDQSLIKLASNSITADETIETLNDIKVSVATDKASVAADKATVSADKADIVSMKSEIANTKTTIDETAQTISENANSVQQEKIAIDETKTDIDKKYTEISNTASKLNTEYNNLTSNYYTKEATNSLISSTTKPKYSVVNELPTSDISTDIIYLKSTNTTSTDGIYEMYTYQDSNWVKIGTSNPDLADYYTKELADSTFATKTEINNTNSEVSELKEDLDELSEATTTSENVEQTDTITPNWKDGYVSPSGYIVSGDYIYTEKINVKQNDVIDMFRSDGGHVNSARFVTYYKDDMPIADKGGSYIPVPFAVPSDVDAVIITISNAFKPYNPYVLHNYQKVILNPILKCDIETIKKLAYKTGDTYVEKFNLNENSSHTLEKEFQNIFGYRILFKADINALSGIFKIFKGEASYGGGIGVDGTNIYQYHENTTTPVRTQPHGLTIKDYVSIVLSVKNEAKATVYLSTNGGRYTWNIPFFYASKGAVKVVNSEAMTRCSLAYKCTALNEPTWLYGDSYFTAYDPARWTYYLIQAGFSKYMLNAYGGRASAEALEMFKNDLSMGIIPTNVVWCLGMNDGDSQSAINDNWKQCIEEVISLCNINKINLYLSTIPNTPTINNRFKNEYVIASGKKYVDFASAVGALNKNTWYEGMLSSDNVHPDVNGAIALYTEIANTVGAILD